MSELLNRSVISWIMALQKISCPNSWSWRKLIHVEKKNKNIFEDVLRILRWEYYLGGPLMQSYRKTYEECRRRSDTEEKEAMWPARQKVEGCGHKPSTPSSHQKEEEARIRWPLRASRGPADIPISAQWNCLSNTGLQEWERINFCWFMLLNLWSFVSADTGN